MTPSHSGKSRNAQRYRYYVTRPDKLGELSACRVSANDLERLVCEQLANKFRDPRWLMDLASSAAIDAQLLQTTCDRGGVIAAELDGIATANKAALLAKLCRQVLLGEEQVDISLNADGVAAALGLEDFSIEPTTPRITISAVGSRSGHQLRLVLPGPARVPNRNLVTIPS